MFFRQGSLGRSIGGASHTRHLCGNKRERGEERDHPRRVERAPFLSRAPRPRATTTPQPDLSVNRPGPRQSGAEASQPRLTPIRAQTAGFFFLFLFFPHRFFFLLFFARRQIKICLCRINTNRSTGKRRRGATRPLAGCAAD